MKNIIKISILMVLAMVVLTACETSDKISGLGSPEQLQSIPQVPENTQVQFVPVQQLGKAGFPVWKSRSVEAGYLYISNDYENLYVTYNMFDRWNLAQTSVSISRSIDGIPRDPQGIPVPDDFKYQSTLNRCENVFTQVIPLADLGLRPGDAFVIASQARVGENKALGQNSGQLSVCVPGKADAQWWFVGQSKINEDLNRPDKEQRLILDDITYDNAMM